MINFLKPESASSEEVRALFHETVHAENQRVDRIFAWLLPIQWLFAVLCAATISPLAWKASQSSIHVHVWLAFLLGGAITIYPLWLIRTASGSLGTRLTISSAQAFFSAMLIHLMGGRIEAHFHVFVSLAVLAAYRDIRTLIPVVLITAIDHLFRSFYWPQSVFGVAAVLPWRAFEHIGWVLFEFSSLCFLTLKSNRHLLTISAYQSELKRERDSFESNVQARTHMLEVSQAFYERVLNSVDTQIGILDEFGTLVFTNDQWKEYTADFVEPRYALNIGQNYVNACLKANHKGVQRLGHGIREVLNGRRDCFVTEYRCCATGAQRWFQIRISPVPVKDGRGVAVAQVDITDMKGAQSRADSLANLILESPNEVYVLSLSTLRFIEVNQGACSNTGYSREELLTMTPSELNVDVSHEDLLSVVKQLQSGEVSTLDFESKHRRKDESEYCCSLSIHKGTFGKEEVLIAYATDLTQRKSLENRLNQAQKLESIGQLAAGIAHEINTPMQCVFGNVEFLQSSCDRLFAVTDAVTALLDNYGLDWEEQREELLNLRKQHRYDYIRSQTPLAIEEAANASKRVISIVRAMKVMSHPGTSEKTRTDLNELIENAATITRNRWKYVANISFDLDRSIESIDALPPELSQVFINMIVNASDAIAERLGPEPAELGEIKLQTRREGDEAVIRIQDDGAGIPESIKRKIFDPFFTTKEVGQGTGQGLAITYDVIVNKHQGSIDVSSIEDCGTTFEIRLPVHDCPASTPDKSSTALAAT